MNRRTIFRKVPTSLVQHEQIADEQKAGSLVPLVLILVACCAIILGGLYA